MYRLYDYDVHTLIDQSEDEADIIDTISGYMEQGSNQRFLISWVNKETNCPDWISIKNVRDYYNYIKDYNDRLKARSCVELKRDIVTLARRKKK